LLYNDHICRLFLFTDLHIHDNFIGTERPNSLTIRQRTPRPGKKPMLMALDPKPLGRDGKSMLNQ